MLSPTEFSKEDAKRANGLREALCECGHEPDEVHVAENVRMGHVIEAVYGVAGDAEALETATAVIEDLPEDKLPDTFYYASGRATMEPEVGPADLGVIWKSLEPADVEGEEPPTPEDMAAWWAECGPLDFPAAWDTMTADEDAPGFATLVEVMVEHLPVHQFTRVAEAVNEEARRRPSWRSWDVRRTLNMGRWQLALSREVPDESEDLPPGVAETSDEDPRGDA